MKRNILLALLVTLGLSACGLSAISPNGQGDQETKKRLNIGWDSGEYRFCEEEVCIAHSMKTLYTPPPAPPEMPKQVVQQPRIERIEYRISFPFNKATPTKEGVKELDRLVSEAQKALRIEVDGRTDNIGQKKANDKLAEKRASYIRAWLQKNGVKAEITASAEGVCCYLVENTSAKGRAVNRRAEIRLFINKEVQ